jgi:hypothetical protein
MGGTIREGVPLEENSLKDLDHGGRLERERVRKKRRRKKTKEKMGTTRSLPLEVKKRTS